MGIKYDEKSCGLIVFREGNDGPKFLLLHYPSGHWDFPKGHVENFDADEQATAARELLEETGIADISFKSGFRIPISYKYRRGGKISNKQVVFFLASTKTENVKISHEHRGHIWLPADSALKKLTFKEGKKLLVEALKFVNIKRHLPPANEN